MWLNSKACKDESCLLHKQYDSSLSDTYEKLGKGLEVEFGTGTLVGEVNSDTVWVGEIKVKSQTFAEIQEERGDIFMAVIYN